MPPLHSILKFAFFSAVLICLLGQTACTRAGVPLPENASGYSGGDPARRALMVAAGTLKSNLELISSGGAIAPLCESLYHADPILKSRLDAMSTAQKNEARAFILETGAKAQELLSRFDEILEITDVPLFIDGIPKSAVTRPGQNPLSIVFYSRDVFLLSPIALAALVFHEIGHNLATSPYGYLHDDTATQAYSKAAALLDDAGACVAGASNYSRALHKWIGSLYQAELGRAPSAEELTAAVIRLGIEGVDEAARQIFAREILLLPEAKRFRIGVVTRKLLGREASGNELNDAVANVFESETEMEYRMTPGLLSTDGFFASLGSPDSKTFILHVAGILWEHQPTEEELSILLQGAEDSTAWRRRTVSNLSIDAEFKRMLVRNYFRDLLGREAREAELQGWIMDPVYPVIFSRIKSGIAAAGEKFRLVD